MNNKLSSLMQKDGARSVLASLISIVIGLLAGAVVILIAGIVNPSLGIRSAWEGIRLVIFGLFNLIFLTLFVLFSVPRLHLPYYMIYHLD